MIIGLSLPAFTLLHVIISLIGIGTGLVALIGLCGGRVLAGWTGIFLVTTVLTSVTGFMFPIASFGPPEIIGVISLASLAIAIVALYVYKTRGAWRWLYVVYAILALYLNVFVGVVQAFQKVPLLHPLAPTGTEPPFVMAQGVVLLVFVALGVAALKRFHPGPTTRILN
jgi:hypothetical protein